jgi:hypothetical protein
MDQKRVKETLRDLRRHLSWLEKRRYSRQPLAEREVVLNWAEMAETLGVSRMSMWRYRQAFPVPPLPGFKSYIKRWAQDHGLPRKRGPLPRQKLRALSKSHPPLYQTGPQRRLKLCDSLRF